MPEQSLNLLFGLPVRDSTQTGMPSTKELPVRPNAMAGRAAGILKTTSNSLQNNQGSKGENSFIAKLVNLMKNASALDGQNSTITPSELNSIPGIEEVNQLIETASVDMPANFATNIHGNQMLLNQVLNHDIPVEIFINYIINNTDNGKTSPVQVQSNTSLETLLPNNQSSGAFNEPNINFTKITQESAEPLKGSSTNSLNVQLDTNKNPAQEQTPAHSLNNFNTNQNNTKTDDQNAADLLSKLNPAKVADTIEKEPASQSSAIPGKQIAGPLKGLNTNSLNVQTDTNKNPSQEQTPAHSLNNFNTNQNNQNNTKINNQNTANNTNKLDPASAIEKTSSDPISQASGISNNKIINPDTLLTPKEGTNNKTHEQLKEQYSGNTLLANSGANSLSQYSSASVQTDSNESQKILDTRPDSAGATVSKSPDNTTSINNYGVNSVNADEAALQLNTSSDNSSFNSQGTDTLSEFYINAVSTKQKAEPETNFTSTLSQINNSTKPFESLGSDTADNIVQKAKLFMEGGKSEIKLQLNPPELGILKLEMAVENDNLEVKITVERSAVKDIIEKDIPRLRELISNADIDVGKLDVSLQENEGENLNLIDKDLQSGPESDSTKDLPDQGNEFLEDSIDEESKEYDKDSNKINYLV